jgi:outer membrane lipoprotein SlyB
MHCTPGVPEQQRSIHDGVRKMKSLRAVSLMLLFTLSTGGCVATTTTATTTYAPEAEWARPGAVAWVREVVHRRQGDPVGGAIAGAIIGGLLGGPRGSGALAGAVGGAVVGAAVSQGSSESRAYEVAVRFDDGGFEVFGYQNFAPFSPGQPVMLTPHGLTGRM